MIQKSKHFYWKVGVGFSLKKKRIYIGNADIKKKKISERELAFFNQRWFGIWMFRKSEICTKNTFRVQLSISRDLSISKVSLDFPDIFLILFLNM